MINEQTFAAADKVFAEIYPKLDRRLVALIKKGLTVYTVLSEIAFAFNDILPEITPDQVSFGCKRVIVLIRQAK